MRLEATIPDSRGTAVQKLADELGLSRSQIIDPQNAQATCELVTPTLAALEWALKLEKLEVPGSALTKMRDMIAAPPRPGAALRAAAERHRR